MVEKLTLSVTEAAQVLGVSRRTVYNLIHQENFPTLMVGGRRLISRELLAEWVREQARGQKNTADSSAKADSGKAERRFDQSRSASQYNI